MANASYSLYKTEAGIKIATPKGYVQHIQRTNGKVKVELKWNEGFTRKWDGKFSKTQMLIDSAVLKFCEPYVPLRTGMLVTTGILGTEIGKGEVAWLAPYAHYQYYLDASGIGPPKHLDALRGPRWFDRMKADRAKDILNIARRGMK